MKLYIVDFDPIFLVPCALVILAENMDNAVKIAHETINHHTSRITVTEIDNTKEGVVLYESGDY